MAPDIITDPITKKQYSRSSPSESYSPYIPPSPTASTTQEKNNPVLNSETLNEEPPLKLPTTPVSTAGVGAQGFFETYLKGQQDRIKAQTTIADAAAKDKTESRGTLEETMAGLLAIPGEQAKLEADADIAGKTQKVTDYTNQLEAEQLAMRRRSEKIRKNDAGLFAGAIEDEVGRVERESLSKQADLALLQSAANRDLATAQSIIDKKIELKLEPLKQKLEFDKFFYEENKDTFTAAEERAFQLQSDSDEQALAHATTELETIHSAFTKAAENGAPDAVLQSILASTTSSDALKAAGQYMQDPLEKQKQQLEIQKLLGEIGAFTDAGVSENYVYGTPEYIDSTIIGSSQYGDKNLVGAQLEQVQKAMTGLSGIETLNGLLIQGQDGLNLTGPVTGRVRGLLTKLGGDADAAAINAAIQGLVPTVARGIFGEVGVLTDTDIANYKKTIPNLTSAEDQNRLVSLIMLDVLGRSMENTLLTNAMNQTNVSNFAPALQNVRARVSAEKARLGVTAFTGMESEDFLDSVPDSDDPVSPFATLFNGFMSQ